MMEPYRPSAMKGTGRACRNRPDRGAYICLAIARSRASISAAARRWGQAAAALEISPSTLAAPDDLFPPGAAAGARTVPELLPGLGLRSYGLISHSSR